MHIHDYMPNAPPDAGGTDAVEAAIRDRFTRLCSSTSGSAIPSPRGKRPRRSIPADEIPVERRPSRPLAARPTPSKNALASCLGDLAN